jgi:putative endonuclease
MSKHYDLGKNGEEIAASYLEDKGYKIVKRNWRFGKDEIDIIAEHNNFLVVVEVKTRSSSFFGNPEEAVDEQKQKFLIRATHEFVMQKEIDLEVRFDIISIVIESNKQSINHFEDAFYPTL